MKLSPRIIVFLSIGIPVIVLGGVFYALRQNSTPIEENLNQYAEIKVIDENTQILNKIPPEAVVEPKANPIKELVQKVERKVEAVNDTYFSKPNVLLNVAFASQAPFGVWDELHQEACEEASMIMVDKYFDGQPLNNTIMESEIQSHIAWQTENGYEVDVTIREAKDIMANYFDQRNTAIVSNPTIEDIKKALSEGKLVIVPAAGRQLGNPYFTPPGPIYHMLVVIGYDDEQKKFITNDPGTKRGASYRYDYEVFMNAIHDWNNGDVANGEKVIMIIGDN